MEDTREFFGITREIKVIPNFIDIDKYDKKHNLCERNMIADGDEKIIVHVSNFRPLKRIKDVLEQAADSYYTLFIGVDLSAIRPFYVDRAGSLSLNRQRWGRVNSSKRHPKPSPWQRHQRSL